MLTYTLTIIKVQELQPELAPLDKRQALVKTNYHFGDEPASKKTHITLANIYDPNQVNFYGLVHYERNLSKNKVGKIIFARWT